MTILNGDDDLLRELRCLFTHLDPVRPRPAGPGALRLLLAIRRQRAGGAVLRLLGRPRHRARRPRRRRSRDRAPDARLRRRRRRRGRRDRGRGHARTRPSQPGRAAAAARSRPRWSCRPGPASCGRCRRTSWVASSSSRCRAARSGCGSGTATGTCTPPGCRTSGPEPDPRCPRRRHGGDRRRPPRTSPTDCPQADPSSTDSGRPSWRRQSASYGRPRAIHAARTTRPSISDTAVRRLRAVLAGES